jgi:hypothetical protein
MPYVQLPSLQKRSNKSRNVKKTNKRNVKKFDKVKIIKKTMEQEHGLYTDPNTFESKKDIERKSIEKGTVSVVYPDRYLPDLSFEELHEDIKRRSEIRQEVENKEYVANIEIQSDKSIAIGWFADIHSGGADVDYDRLKWEADEIKRNPYMKIFLGGDLCDAYTFNPAQFGDVANINEQKLYLSKLLEYIGYENILCGVNGNHERFVQRGGLDFYPEVRRKIPVFDGVGTVKLKINDIEYVGALMHKPKGYSVYNPNHPQKRFSMDNEGYDFIMTAHIHEGAEQSQLKKTADGVRKQVFLSGKTFKRTDDFLDMNSQTRKGGEALGTNWIVFNNKKKMMIPLSSTAEVIEVYGGI